MDIAAMSMQMSSAKLHDDIGIAVLKKAMDTSSEMAQSMVEQLIHAPAQVTSSGATGHVDVYI